MQGMLGMRRTKKRVWRDEKVLGHVVAKISGFK
jgi:hypothetical protein